MSLQIKHTCSSIFIRFKIQTKSESSSLKNVCVSHPNWNHVSCVFSSFCMFLCLFRRVSFPALCPCQDRLPVIEPFSPPDLTPECPVRSPSVSRYTHINISLTALYFLDIIASILSLSVFILLHFYIYLAASVSVSWYCSWWLTVNDLLGHLNRAEAPLMFSITPVCESKLLLW